jgi:hypothetical protein
MDLFQNVAAAGPQAADQVPDRSGLIIAFRLPYGFHRAPGVFHACAHLFPAFHAAPPFFLHPQDTILLFFSLMVIIHIMIF